jgi:hypothetical protein
MANPLEILTLLGGKILVIENHIVRIVLSSLTVVETEVKGIECFSANLRIVMLNCLPKLLRATHADEKPAPLPPLSLVVPANETS